MRKLLLIGTIAVCLLAAGVADGAFIRVGNLVLTADGGFTPRALPRRAFAPIEFEGHANVKSTDGSVPAASLAANVGPVHWYSTDLMWIDGFAFSNSLTWLLNC